MYVTRSHLHAITGHMVELHTWAVTYMMSPTLVGCAKARLSKDPVSKCPLRPMRLAAMYAHCSIHRITYSRIPSTQLKTTTRQLNVGDT